MCTVRREEREGKVSFDPKMSISTQKQIGIRRGKKKKTSSIENFGRPPPTGERKKTEKGRDRKIAQKSRSNVPPSDLSSFADPLFARANAFRARFPPKTVPTNSGSPVLLAFFEKCAQKKQIRLSFERSARKCTYLVKFVAFTAACPPTLELAPPTLVADARARASLSNRNARLRDIFYLRENVSAALFRLFLALFFFSLSLSPKGRKREKRRREQNPKPYTERRKKKERKREKGGIIRLVWTTTSERGKMTIFA